MAACPAEGTSTDACAQPPSACRPQLRPLVLLPVVWRELPIVRLAGMRLAAEVLSCGAWCALDAARVRGHQATPSQAWGPGLLERQATSARPSACGRHWQSGKAVGWNRGRQRRAKEGGRAGEGHTSVMNFLQTGRTSADSVAENIMTCLSCGVALKISCTSARMSARVRAPGQHAWPEVRVY